MGALDNLLGNVVGSDGIKADVGFNEADVNNVVTQLGKLIILFFLGLLLVLIVWFILKKQN
jgi:hypothetical protein